MQKNAEHKTTNYKTILKHISTYIFDYDGVLTNGDILVTLDGDTLRTINAKDGYALQYAVKKGLRIIILTGAKSQSIRNRFINLGIKEVYQGIEDKYDFFISFVKNHELDSKNILYMGDDIPDYKVMEMVGLPACPADAAEEIKLISKYISDKKGGCGCVRDVLEQSMKLQEIWMNDEAFIW